MTDAPPPAYSAPAPAPANPGKTMGIIALVLSIIGFVFSLLGIFSLAGVILGFVGRNQSKKAGQKNGVAVAAIILGFIGMVIGIIIVIALVAGGTALFGVFNQVCSELGTGVWEVDGATITCP